MIKEERKRSYVAFYKVTHPLGPRRVKLIKEHQIFLQDENFMKKIEEFSNLF